MEKEISVVKTGYLLKWLIKRWKLNWFTLNEDELRCFIKRDKSVLIESIPLQGASVVCPCYDEPEVNIDRAFKLTSPNGTEMLFLAAGLQDRDRWAHAIGAVIRSITTSSQTSNSPVKFQPFRAKANVSEVLGALQDPDAGVEMTNHVRNGIVHKNCFKGSDIIKWLLRWNIVRRRGDGIAMAQSLLKLGHLQEVDVSDGAAGASQSFKDDEKLYRFTSLNLGVQRNSYFDSSDSDSSLSDDEDDGKIVERVKKGKIIKAGFLCKKKSLRKGWRFVRVLLRDSQPMLEYESPFRSKEQKTDPKNQSKVIDLQKCFLAESSRRMIGVKIQQAPAKLRIYLRTKGGKCRTFQTKDEGEWFEYASLLQTLCGATPPPVKIKTKEKNTEKVKDRVEEVPENVGEEKAGEVKKVSEKAEKVAEKVENLPPKNDVIEKAEKITDEVEEILN
ncbi:pleckstrin-like [Mya arenaria]|uniref:pleckstrin-like n=1 Tax=Mya arenaria TaxID=6604 RepID=UPI0022E765F2|nr:pleckstrin-like [Mya arenaria]